MAKKSNDKKQYNNSNPIIKVVYFDELSATDYIVISVGGAKQETSEDVQDDSKKVEENAGGKSICKIK
ncbi:MAG: hypothetical protein LBM93_12640 [Oscillospiraceae bacterium]|jgi:hypothetical protein|nr:hypothetical protein [Oscillospiraceae bacterium]